MNNNKLNGIYLVVDPAMEHAKLLPRVQSALQGGAGMLQVWNHWSDSITPAGKEQFIDSLIRMANEYSVPVLINDDWKLLMTTGLDGVHFDEIPEDLGQIREKIGRTFIAGFTCGNDLQKVAWAEENDLDYISFCAMFPSPSVNRCHIVHPETVRRARQITDKPLFLSGGITPEKIEELGELDFDGVAVISGILKDDHPRQKTTDYRKALLKKYLRS